MVNPILAKISLLCLLFTPVKSMLSKHCLSEEDFDTAFESQLQGSKLIDLVRDSNIVLGNGGFGAVKEILWKKDGVVVPVAVKLISVFHEVLKEPIKREIDFLFNLKGSEYVLDFYGCMETLNNGLVDSHPADTPLVIMVTEKLAKDFKNEQTSINFKSEPAVDSLETYLNIAKAIQFLKDKKIVHSDLKPANVMTIDKDLRKVKLIDFGLSVELGQPWIGGSAENAPPEVTPNETPTTTSIDVFGFGTTVAAMEFSPGKLEYESEKNPNPLEIINGREAFAKAATRLISTLNKYTNPDYNEDSFAKLIQDCVSVNPNDRPTIEQVIERLEGLKESFQKKEGHHLII